MADPPVDTTSTESGAATVSKQLSLMVLQTDETMEAGGFPTRERQDSVSSTNGQPAPLLGHPAKGEEAASPIRRPLFSSMREALESSGQVKEEPGGYVIKRRSSGGRQQQQQQQLRSGESTGRSKNRHTKQRASKGGGEAHTPANVEDEADAAGYTVIRRRASCDESSSASASAAAPSHSARRNPRASTQDRGKKQQQRPRRGSMSALQHSSSLSESIATPSSSVPPGFQPRTASQLLRPPPGLTPAASGWVVKAAAPSESANKIAEPPVEALWPEMTTTAKTESGWAAAVASESLQAPAWPPTATESALASDRKEEVDDDDLLALLGVKL